MAVHPITGAVDARISGSFAGSLSRNGEFFTTGFTSVRGGNYVLKINPDYTWEERPVNNSSPASLNAIINGAAISNDGLHVLNVTYDGRKPWVLKWNGTEYGFLYELPTLLSGRPTCADYSEDGRYLAVGYWFSVDIYERTGDTYTFLDRFPPGNFNGNQIESVRWSHDGTKLVVGMRSNILVYSFNGTVATLIYTGPGTVNGWGVEWSLDDDYLFSNAQPGDAAGAWIWTVAGTTVTPYITSGSGIAAIQFESPLSPIVIEGSEYMLAVTNTTPYLKAYEKSSGYTTFVDAATLGFTQPTAAVPGKRMGSAFNPDGSQRIVFLTASGASPTAYGFFIEAPPAVREMEGDIEFPFVEFESAANLSSPMSGDIEWPFVEMSAAVALDDVIYPYPAFNVRTQYITVRTGGELVIDSTPLPFMYGDVEFPFVEFDAVVTGIGIFNDAEFPFVEMEARVEQDRAIEADVEWPFVEMTGEFFQGINLVSDVEFPFVEMEGRLESERTLAGDVEFPFVETDGKIELERLIESDAEFPFVENDIDVNVVLGIRSDVEFPFVEMDGRIEVERTIAADVEWPFVESDGMIELERLIESDAEFPFVEFDIGVKYTNIIDANIDWPFVEFEAELDLRYNITSDVEFPFVDFAAEVLLFRRVWIDAVGFLPTAAIEVDVVNDVALHATGYLPTAAIEVGVTSDIVLAAVGHLPRAEIVVEQKADLTVDAIGFLPTASIAVSTGFGVTIEAMGFLPTSEIEVLIQAGSIEAVGFLPTAAIEVVMAQNVAIAAVGFLPVASIEVSLTMDAAIAAVGFLPTAEILVTAENQVTIGAVGFLPRARIIVSDGSSPPSSGGSGVSTSGGGGLSIGGGGVVFSFGQKTSIG